MPNFFICLLYFCSRNLTAAQTRALSGYHGHCCLRSEESLHKGSVPGGLWPAPQILRLLWIDVGRKLGTSWEQLEGTKTEDMLTVLGDNFLPSASPSPQWQA